MEVKKEECAEYYEKCRALIRVLDTAVLDKFDSATLMWLLRDCFDKLGDAIGIMSTK